MNIIEYENYHEHHEEAIYDFPYLTYPCSIPGDFSRVPLHWHDEMEFIYIKKGSGMVSVDQHHYPVSAGDLVFICPGQLHSIEQYRQESMEYENIIFQLSLLDSRQPSDTAWNKYLAPIEQRNALLPVLLSPHMESYAPIAACVDQIDEIRRTFPLGFEMLIKGKLFELFFLLYEFRLVSLRTHASVPGQRAQDKKRQVLKYVEQHYSEDLSIKTMAEACGFSQSHFMKFFKNTFGTTFTSYLNDYRLTMASRLLVSSEDSILTVAVESGFNNLSYFNRIFKKKFGKTPREFRYCPGA